MRVIFAGTPEFARTALERLHASGHTIALVLTQPDRPAGRGLKLQPSVVKQMALEQGFALAQPRSLRLDGKYPEDARAARQAIADAHADVMVVAAYGLILPQWVLDDMAPTLPAARGPQPPEGALAPGGGPAVREGMAPTPDKLGCLNIHASLLPRWRGAAPIHRAIEAGDAQSGVTIMQMDAGLDTGDMLLVHSVDIADNDTTATLHDRLAAIGGDLVVQALDLAAAHRLVPQRQPEDGITYAHKIDKAEAAIDWRQPASAIARRVRAFNPFPAATATLEGEVLKVWAAHAAGPADSSGLPMDMGVAAAAVCGTVLAVAPTGIAVAAMGSVAVLTELQRPGGKRLAVSDFVRGFTVQPGMRFATVAEIPAHGLQTPPI